MLLSKTTFLLNATSIRPNTVDFLLPHSLAYSMLVHSERIQERFFVRESTYLLVSGFLHATPKAPFQQHIWRLNILLPAETSLTQWIHYCRITAIFYFFLLLPIYPQELRFMTVRVKKYSPRHRKPHDRRNQLKPLHMLHTFAVIITLFWWTHMWW